MSRHRTLILPVSALLTLILVVETAFVPQALAASSCREIFSPPSSWPRSRQSSTQISNALDFRSDMQSTLGPKDFRRFERGFKKRHRVRAETEAMRLTSALLRDDAATSMKLLSLLEKNSRETSIEDVLLARLKHQTMRLELENAPLEIGYGEGSKLSSRWREFREKHAGRLALVRRVAINVASLQILGLPVDLRSIRYQNFGAAQAERSDWARVEPEIRKRITSRESALQREIKIEIAVEFALRVVALAVLAILTDEFLDFLTPKWGLLKAKVAGSVLMESRETLERLAIENFKDIAEAFTGIRPRDDAPEVAQIKAQIKATSQDDLWLHVHQGGPLAEAVMPAPRPDSASEASQMNRAPIFEP